MDTIVFELYQNPLEQVRIINEKAKEASKQIEKELKEKSSPNTLPLPTLWTKEGERGSEKWTLLRVPLLKCKVCGRKIRMVKKIGIVTGWRKLQKMWGLIGKSLEEKLLNLQ